MNDIVIPADTAKEIADFLMRKGLGPEHNIIKLLVPKFVPDSIVRDGYVYIRSDLARNKEDNNSLRDEVLEVMLEVDRRVGGAVSARHADAVLAVVRKHIEALDRHVATSTRDVPVMSKGQTGLWLFRHDVLRLLDTNPPMLIDDTIMES